MNNIAIIAISISCVILLCVLIIILLVVLKHTKKKRPKIKVDEVFINNLMLALGSKANIALVATENGRTKFTLKDLDKANLEALKKLSNAGVFVTGNIVKMLFSYDSDLICQTVKHIIKED